MTASPSDTGGAPDTPDTPDTPDPPGACEALAALEAAGFPVAAFSPEQSAVLAGLSGAEVALLTELKRRLDAVEPEVQAHNVIAGAALF